MGLRDLLQKSKDHAPKPRTSGEDRKYLHIMDMSKKPWTDKDGNPQPGGQGTIKFLPITGIDGEEIKYLYNVYNYRYEYDTEYEDKEGNTVQDTRISVTHYADAEEYQMELSDDDRAKILKVRSLIKYFMENVNGFPEAEIKNYALIFGYVLEHVDINGNYSAGKNEDGSTTRYPALLVFPSKNFSVAVTKLAEEINSLGDLSAETYDDIFTRKSERQLYLQVSFSRGASFGYDTTIQYKSIDRFSASFITNDELKSGKISIPQEDIDLCTSLSAIFLANNRTGLDQFNTSGENVIPNDFDSEFTDGVIDQLESIIKLVDEQTSAEEALPTPPSKNKRKKNDLDE